ncbi:MAG TPA: CoA-binding protein [Chitinophagales bacterium]|nr:CoA-binding protein [Chitinophagales bacterium]HNM32855.1 CoA-binding protein [Chitinophagales bacterium]
MNKKTVVIGASAKEDRYSNRAVRMLKKHGHDVIALGFEPKTIDNIPIETDWKNIDGVDTVSLYLNPQRQQEYYSYILSLHPKRIIFNPGTENPVLEQMAKNENIKPLEACTLVLLSTEQY